MTALRTCLLALIGCLASAAIGAAAPLAPEAEAAFEEGGAAGEAGAWALAIESFTRAQELAPTSPRILHNLGVAHAHAGHEIAAVAWLRAYLAARKAAPDATGVAAEIERLKRRASVKIDAITKEGAQIEERLDHAGLHPKARDYAVLLARFALQAEDVDAAAASIDTLDARQQDAAWSEVALFLAERRQDAKRAKDAALRVTSQAQQQALLAKIDAVGAVPAMARALDRWVALARALSARPEIVALAAQIAVASEGEASHAALRLMTTATELSEALLSVKALEDEWGTGQ